MSPEIQNMYDEISYSPFFTQASLMEDFDLTKNKAYSIITAWSKQGMIKYPLPISGILQTTSFFERSKDPKFQPIIVTTGRRYLDFLITWAHIQNRMPYASFNLETYKTILKNFPFMEDHKKELSSNGTISQKAMYDAFRNDISGIRKLLKSDLSHRQALTEDALSKLRPALARDTPDSLFEKWCRFLDLETLMSALNPDAEKIHLMITLRRIREVQSQPNGQFKALPYLRRFQQATKMTIEQMKDSQGSYMNMTWPTQEALDSDISYLDEDVLSYKGLSEAQRVLMVKLENLFLFTDEAAYQMSVTKRHAVWRTLKGLQDKGLIKRVPYFTNTYRHSFSDVQMRFFNAPSIAIANNDMTVDWCMYWSRVQEAFPDVGFTPAIIREVFGKRPDLVVLPEPKYWDPVELETVAAMPTLMKNLDNSSCVTTAKDGNRCLTPEFMKDVKSTRGPSFNQQEEALNFLSCLSLKNMIRMMSSNTEDYIFLYVLDVINNLRLEKDTKSPDIAAQTRYINRLCEITGLTSEDFKEICKQDPSVKPHIPTRRQNLKQPTR